MKKFSKFTFGALFLFGALAIASCGGNNDTPTSGDTPVTTSTSGEHQHSYQFNSFEWIETPGAYAAKAVYTCSAGDSTVKYDATVTKTAHVDATCSAAGSNTWKASYDGHEDTKDEVVPKLDHVKGDDGFCSLCHEVWLGETNESLEFSRSVTSGDKIFTRVPVLPGRLYHYTIDISFLGSGTSSFFVDTEYNKTPVVEEDPVEVPSNSDGYVYFVLDITKTGTFEMSFSLIDVHDHEPNGLGFCMHCGKYLGSSVNDGSTGIDLQPIFEQSQAFFRVKYYPNRYNNVFISNAENALHESVIFALYYFDTDHNPTLIEENITTEAIVEGDLDIHSYDRYIYVTFDSNDSMPSGNVYLAPLAFNGYDDIPTIRHYHGPSIVTDDITSLDPRFIDVYETSPYYKSRYIVRATGLTIGTCYRMRGEDFGFNTLEAYTVQANLSTPVELRHGEYFVAPSNEVVFVIQANNKLDSTYRVSIRTGHFHVNDEPYYGFYCWAHETPVWIGETENFVLNHTYNIHLNAYEERYYRISLDEFWAGDGFELNTYSGFEATLYYFNGEEMCSIDEDHYVWENLPNNCYEVVENEGVFYYLHIENDSATPRDLELIGSLVHNNINAAGVCSNCFDYMGTTYVEGTHGEPGKYERGTPFTYNFPANKTTYLAIEIPQGHQTTLRILGGNTSITNTFYSNCEVKFYRVDDEAQAHEISDASFDSEAKLWTFAGAQDWLDTHDKEDERTYGYLYVSVTNNSNADINYVELTVNHTHVLTHALCDCGQYNGTTKSIGANSSFSLNAGQSAYYRFNFQAGKQYQVTLTPHGLTEECLTFTYKNNAGELINLPYEEMASADTSDYLFTVPSDAESRTGFIYMDLKNTTGATLSVQIFQVNYVN